MEKESKIEIFDGSGDLAEAAARFIVATAREAIAARGKFVISLSGGHTPEQLFTLLATQEYREQISWNRTFVFWGDERCVPADDDQNNAHRASILLLDHVGIPPANINPIPVDLPPKEAAEAYARTIRLYFGSLPPQFDLILLGLGENGHTASLFPGNDIVFEPDEMAREIYLPEQNTYRITMTPDLINQASQVLFLVSGAGKAGIVNSVLHEALQPGKYPAQLIKPVDGKLYWYLDKDAAALLAVNNAESMATKPTASNS